MRSDVRARYGRGTFRWLKWLLDPFALLGVYLLLIAFVLERPGRAPGLSLACAIVPFQLVMMAVINGLQSINLRRPIFVNMAFPRALVPLASTLTESIAFAGSLSMLALMMAAYGIAPTVAALWLVPALLVTLALGAACAYPAALFGVWFPKAHPLAVSAVRTLSSWRPAWWHWRRSAGARASCCPSTRSPACSRPTVTRSSPGRCLGRPMPPVGIPARPVRRS